MSDQNSHQYDKTSFSTVGGRLKNRASYDATTIHAIVNEALVSHVAFVDEEGLPQIIPMNAQVEEDEEGFYVLLHGYRNGRFIKLCSQPNTRLVVSSTLVDGRILGLTAKSHSFNYRSAVLHGYSEPVSHDDFEEKLRLSQKIVDHIIPGRFKELRPPNKTDIHDVGYIKMRIETASAKARTGGPGDTQADRSNDSLADNVWAGVIPIHVRNGTPEPADYNKAKLPKDYWS